MAIYVGDKLISGQIDINEFVKLSFDAVYPVGAYYFGNTKPSLGTWEEVDGDRAVWIKKGTADGTTLSQALPKPTITLNNQGEHTHNTNNAGDHTHDSGITWQGSGGLDGWVVWWNGSQQGGGALGTSSNGDHIHTTTSNGNHTHTATVETSGAYGIGTKVQPDALVMRVWKRTA